MDDLWDVSDCPVYQNEAMGDGRKIWIFDDSETKWLFKENRDNRSPDEGASEFVASKIAKAIHLPAAEVRIGEFRHHMGALSRNLILDSTHEFIEGSTLLPAFVDNFDPKARDAAGHAAATIVEILQDIQAPRDLASELSAIESFGLYLLFDALIGNTDRHSGNWAVESSLIESDRLLPSYDHATSLGITARHEYRDKLLTGQKSIGSFVRGAKAHRFELGKKLTLVDFAFQYCHSYAPRIPRLFQEMLQLLHLDEVEHFLASSQMSAPGAMLAMKVIELNKERIRTCLRTSM